MKRQLLRIQATLAIGLLFACASVTQVIAQEQFFTQSGGRGLQNAKTNARLSKAENDIGGLQAEMAKIQPFAKVPIDTCSGAGDKLRWDGNNWACNSETDPTVQDWAKESLPTCTGTSILGVSGGKFSCVSSGFVSNELDPTVQPFAKASLPGCGSGEVLASNGSALVCVSDERGLTREVDPFTHDFARSDKSSVPNCNDGTVLTLQNGTLRCVVDQGISSETDPRVQSFARNDLSGYTLAACASGELIRSVTVNSHVELECVAGSSALDGALGLDNLSDVIISSPVSGSVLVYNGSSWVNGSESDPSARPWAKVALGSADAACAAGEVVGYNGSKLTCVSDAGGTLSPLALSGLSDVAVSSTVNGNLLQYHGASSKWVPATIDTCGTGEMLTSTDGVNFSCAQDAGGSANPLTLNDLGDVTISSPVSGSILRYVGSLVGWVNTEDKMDGTYTDTNWCRYDSASGNVNCNLAPPTTCGVGDLSRYNGTAFECVSATTVLGLGSMALQSANDVSISGGSINSTTIGNLGAAAGTFTNLYGTYLTAPEALITSATIGTGRITSLLVGNGNVIGDLMVGGNFYVSGTQSFDGVTFANNGIVAAGDVNISGTTRVQNLEVLGNQSIAGVLFANGGIQLSGDITAGRISATYISGTLAHLTNAAINSLSAGAVAATNTSITTNLDVGGLTRITGGLTVAGPTALSGTTYTQDLYVRGSLYVSGTQSIDGVTFANGGVQATGMVTATAFSGDGSALTNLNTGGFDDDRIVSGTSSVFVANNGVVSVTIGGANVANFGAGGLGVTAVATSGGLTVGGHTSTTTVSGTLADFASLRSSAAAITALAATNTSITTNLDVGGLTRITGGLTVAGPTALSGTTYTQDLYVRGSLYVSGTQSIDGVTFANGGVQATGMVTATAFSGDGSALTNLNTGGFDDDRIVSGTSSVFVANNGAVSVTIGGANVANFGAGGLGVTSIGASGLITAVGGVSTSGLVTLHNSGAETCSTGQRAIRIDPATGALQLCRD